MNKLMITACLAASALVAGAADVSKQVRADFSDYGSRAFVHYAVPALSENQRLPDAYPADGLANAPVKIFAAKDEYEPGAFEVWGVKDLGKVRFEIGDFKQVEKIGGGGEKQGEKVGGEKIFPKENIDLKLVKCWYQNLNAWFSYFSDCGDSKLVPELLVNDEDLIRTDAKKKANYARIEVGSKNEKVGSKDARCRWQWINPPKEVEAGPVGVFRPMAPGFSDAATLQPVTLPKNQFREFLLTVHTPKDLPAGVYKGEIVLKKGQETGDKRQEGQSQIYGTIPVEIHVADYVLPQPKCYREADRDFLVGSYNRLGVRDICAMNGGDERLAVKQIPQILRTLARHNMKLHMAPYSIKPDGEAFWTVSEGLKAGMSREAFMSCFVPWAAKGDEAALPKRIADEYDRRFGFHTCYVFYGDEPCQGGQAGFVEMMEKWQPWGFRNVLAGAECVYLQMGFALDWANIAHDPTDRVNDEMRYWQNQPGKRVAWYADQHVGSENPAFHRRQNGLAAWLNGYNCSCNYALHLGPYNDDIPDLYRPMVYFYGTYDGVLDTLAWEGFREGLDDIRYATLLAELARKAEKSPDVKVRHLGGKAFQFLALIRPEDFTANTVRAEMRHWIDRLLAHAKPDPVVEIPMPAPKPAAAEAALAAELKPLEADLAAKKPGAAAKRDAVYLKYYRTEDLSRVLEKEGDLLGAAKQAEASCQYERADELRLKFLRDPKRDMEWRARSAWAVLYRRPELWDDKDVAPLLRYVWRNDTNYYVNVLCGLTGGASHTYKARDTWIKVYGLAAKALDSAGIKGLNEGVADFGVRTFAARRDYKAAREVVARFLSGKDVKPETRYRYGLFDALLAAGMKNAEKVIADYEKAKLPKDMKPNARIAAIAAAGVFANQIGDEAATRALYAYRQGLYKPQPRRQYTVVFSDKTLEDAASWENPAIPEAICDRKYGGSTELLESDVTTGSRVVGQSKDRFEPMRMKVAADAWGIHLRFESFDPKCCEFEGHGVTGGTMEGYLAPGKNRPYICFFKNDADDDWTVFNSCYDARGQQLVRKTCPQYLKARRVFEGGRMVHYLAFAWDNYVNDLPKNGSVWDFEPLYWGRTGQSSWNGVRVIHGRSTWGELVFSLSDADRAKILRRLESQVYWRFRRDTGRTEHLDRHVGPVRRWKDKETGDVAFWKEVVVPYVQNLEETGKVLYEHPSDATLLRLANDGILQKWQNVRFDVDLMRQRWLER